MGARTETWNTRHCQGVTTTRSVEYPDLNRQRTLSSNSLRGTCPDPAYLAR
ncbi:hypothetical protein OH799_08290 [Nocardia sp. NBC_00881]|uniref:hypothetical protein n=1 Tax=Nocardia sp. NBC_00881 TaxID=2975995 RepID=UPI00387091FC|nr:hypothetical protein OH799_08290 [Nocardia sp. NBC_00881]